MNIVDLLKARIAEQEAGLRGGYCEARHVYYCPSNLFAFYLLQWRLIEHPLVDKGKPGASRGRKATGPTRSAGPPNSKVSLMPPILLTAALR
jgi:hypothetical protein